MNTFSSGTRESAYGGSGIDDFGLRCYINFAI